MEEGEGGGRWWRSFAEGGAGVPEGECDQASNAAVTIAGDADDDEGGV